MVTNNSNKSRLLVMGTTPPKTVSTGYHLTFSSMERNMYSVNKTITTPLELICNEMPRLPGTMFVYKQTDQ